MNINRGQVLSILIVVLGVCVASTAQLTDLFGPAITKYITSSAGLLLAIFAGINTQLQSQGSQIAAVQSMAGVDKIVVNERANPTLATMAVDPTNPKIAPTAQAERAVQATAAAAS